jgi:hypothetical protein
MKTISGGDALKFVVMVYQTMGDGAQYLGAKGYGKAEDAILFNDTTSARQAAKAVTAPTGFPFQGTMRASELCKALARIQKNPDFVAG